MSIQMNDMHYVVNYFLHLVLTLTTINKKICQIGGGGGGWGGGAFHFLLPSLRIFPYKIFVKKAIVMFYLHILENFG